MIEQQGYVTRLDGEFAQVRVGGQSGCPKCDAGEGCGAGLFGRLINQSETEIPVRNTADAGKGQTVTLGLPEKQFLQLVLLIYGVPLAAAVLGSGCAYALSKTLELTNAWTDVMSAFGGVAGLGVGLVRAKREAGGAFISGSLTMVDTSTATDCGRKADLN